jgi:hypothetical protein
MLEGMVSINNTLGGALAMEVATTLRVRRGEVVGRSNITTTWKRVPEEGTITIVAAIEACMEIDT